MRNPDVLTRRLFFALWPDETTRAALAHATHKAVRASGGRPVPPENLHATLLFLGAVPADRVPQLEAAASAVQPRQFIVTLDRTEHWGRQGVLCASATHEPEAAGALASELARNVMKAGFAPDLKPFRVHVTVARKVVKPHSVGPIHPVQWRVADFALVESQTLPEGSRYTVVRLW